MGQKKSGNVIVRKLRFDDRTPDGRYYAVLGRSLVYVQGRCFWPTKRDAIQCALRALNEARPR